MYNPHLYARDEDGQLRPRSAFAVADPDYTREFCPGCGECVNHPQFPQQLYAPDVRKPGEKLEGWHNTCAQEEEAQPLVPEEGAA